MRGLPSVDLLVRQLSALRPETSPALLTALARERVTRARTMLVDGTEQEAADRTVPTLVREVLEHLDTLLVASPTRVLNATGVILHTNLGRAPLSAAAQRAMVNATSGYSDLEYDLTSGNRGSRHAHVEPLLRRVTGAEGGFAVNNAAAALLLTLAALCAGREVVISRAQLVEIGGGFRIPDVLRQSGAQLVEVGTTNRTYLRDYTEAIGPNTAALLRVHASNFRIIGFTHEPTVTELATLAHSHGLLLLDDIGSGCLLPTAHYGLAPEPTVQQSIAAGADLTLFSGDKLLGGPQAGITVGRAAAIGALQRHPLARAVRLDKANLAALTATLRQYAQGEAERMIPVWQMIAASPPSLHARATAWAHALGDVARVQESHSMIGGGSLPGESLPTHVVSLVDVDVTGLAARLRRAQPPLIVRVERNALLLDPRTIDPDDDALVVRLLSEALHHTI